MENKFYVIQIARYNDGSKDSYSVYAYESQTEALKVFHQKLASSYGNAKNLFTLVILLNDYGNVLRSESVDNIPSPASDEAIES